MLVIAVCGVVLGLLLRRVRKPSGDSAQTPKQEIAVEGLHLG
jgi:hypothetical protein